MIISLMRKPAGLALLAALFCLLLALPALAQEQSEEGMLEITVEDAILFTLKNNRSLRVERLAPSIVETFEGDEQAVFDPVITGEASVFEEKGQRVATSGSIFENTLNREEASLSLSRFFSTGTRLGVDTSVSRLYSDLSPERYSSRLGVSITQALLEGRGSEANLASLRQAQLDTRASEYELRGFAEELVAQVERTYWDYYLSRQQVDIFVESLRLSEQQLDETRERIAAGTLAETELTAAQAEMALRREDLINARSTLERTRLELLRLMNPPGDNLWGMMPRLLDHPALPEVRMDPVESHVAVALRMRSVLNQARLEVERGDLEVVKTRNGLLPVLDFFVTLGKSGYSDSFGGSVENITGDFYDVLAGVRVELPLRNSGDRARHRRALISREQAGEALDNLAQLVELDVRSAYIEVNRTQEQITATAATRKLQEEKLRVETEKHRVGRSTSFLVAQAQRDLVASRISEVQATVNYLKALIELYRLEGSLLERRGIKTPAGMPVP